MILTALFIFSPEINTQAQQKLGLWVVRDQLANRNKIDTFIDFAAQNRISELFVQIRGRGDAFYFSDLVAPSENMTESSWDPLTYTLDKAHAKNLRVHVWLNAFLLWSAEQRPQDHRHLLYQHPDWCAVDADGVKDIQKQPADFRRNGTEGIYLSPLVPQVREYLLSVIREILTKYPIDGVHLDYVRYAKDCYDYNPIGRKLFRDRYGVDPLLLTISDKSLFKGWELGNLETLQEQWSAFRREAVSDFIQACAGLIDTQTRPILLSAAVKPDPGEARQYFFQDWEHWLRQGWLDFAVLMNYYRGTEQFENVLKKISPQIQKERLWVGIGVYNLNKYDALSRILVTLNNQFGNLVFFSYDTFQRNPDYFPVLQKALLINH